MRNTLTLSNSLNFTDIVNVSSNVLIFILLLKINYILKYII